MNRKSLIPVKFFDGYSNNAKKLTFCQNTFKNSLQMGEIKLLHNHFSLISFRFLFLESVGHQIFMTENQSPENNFSYKTKVIETRFVAYGALYVKKPPKY